MSNKEVSVGVKFTGSDAGFQRVVGNLNTSVAGIKKSMSGLQTVMGGAAMLGAIELGKKAWEGYKTVMNSTEGTAEKLEQQIAFLDGTMGGLVRTIATGSWETLISNITTSAEATRDLRAAMQEYEHAAAGTTIKKGRLSFAFQELRVDAAEEQDPGRKAKILQEAIDVRKELTAVEVTEIQKRLGITEEYYKKITGHSKEYFDYFLQQVPKLAQEYDYYFGKESVALEGITARLGDLKYLGQLGPLTKAQEDERRQLQLLSFVLEDYTKIQDDFSKKGQWDEYIKGIADMSYASAAGEKALLRLVKQLATTKAASGEVTRESGISAIGGKYNVLGALIGAENDKSGLRPDRTPELTNGLGIAQTAVENLSGAFEELFLNTGGGFKGMVDSMLSSLQMLFAKLIGKAALFGLLQLLFPGSGAAVSALSGLRSFIGIPGFASGTNFAPGGLALVGERGPELVNLPRGSQVIPNKSGVVKLSAVLKGRDIYLSGVMYQNMLSTNT